MSSKTPTNIVSQAQHNLFYDELQRIERGEAPRKVHRSAADLCAMLLAVDPETLRKKASSKPKPLPSAAAVSVGEIKPKGTRGRRAQASRARTAFRLLADEFMGGIWVLDDGHKPKSGLAPVDVAELIETEPGVCQWLDGTGQPIAIGF
jgi:hypothetical protein